MTEIIEFDTFRNRQSKAATPTAPAEPIVLERWKADMDARAIGHFQAVRAEYLNGGAVSLACRSQATRLAIDLLAEARDEAGMREMISALAVELQVYSHDPHTVAMAKDISRVVRTHYRAAEREDESQAHVTVRLSTMYQEKASDIIAYLYEVADGMGERDEHHEIEMVGVPAGKAQEVRQAILAICGEAEEDPDFLTIEVRPYDAKTGAISDLLL